MIELKHVWVGLESNMQVIPIGTYTEDAPELFGLGAYLVENGHAKIVGAKPKEPITDEPDSPDDIAINQQILGNRIIVKDGKIVANTPKPKAKK